jgi:opacity protein-like surface antigen
VRRNLFVFFICLAFAAVGTSTFAGRPDKSWKKWFGHFSGGYTMAQGDFGDLVDDDWTLAGGATYWPENWPVGLDLELSWNDLDVSSDAIQAINNALEPPSDELTGGGVSIWSVTTDFVWSPGKGSFSPYIVGGIGVYRLDAELTSSGLIYYPPICGWWWCVPGGVGEGSIVEADASSTDFGVNLGIGLNWELTMGSQIYVEAKYHYVDSDPVETTFIPFVIGYRW